jgi:hypothetical protein
MAVHLEDSRLFRIDQRKYEFISDDPIFFLDKPTPKKDHLAEKGLCTCCETSFKSVKSVSYW